MSLLVKNNFDELLIVLEENKYDQIFVLVDQNTSIHCYSLIEQLLPNAHLIEIGAGEKNKQIDTCCNVWQQLNEHLASRHSLLINLGGGMVSDLGGFVAATFKRGIDFINIPTSLLAMVDASIGGKTGIDFLGIKNMIGLIIQPKMVLINPVFLKTLPQRQLLSGFAEMLKHGMIADHDYLNELLNTKVEELKNWTLLIQKSIEIKQRIVTIDPTEQGLRKTLNFGHTVGHALESHFLGKTDRELLHGEAVAWGMVVESFLSMEKLGFPPNDFITFRNFIQQNYNGINLTIEEIEMVCSLMYHDKKNIGNSIYFALLKEIGKAQFDESCEENLIKNALKILNEFQHKE